MKGLRKFYQCSMKKKIFFFLSFQQHIRNQDVLKTSINKENCTIDPEEKKKKRLKNRFQWRNSSFIRQTEHMRTVLPPLGSWPCALAAATCFTGALGAGEELGHELRDVWKLRVGAQHVHGLLDFL